MIKNNFNFLKYSLFLYGITFVLVFPIILRKVKYSLYYTPPEKAREYHALEMENNERLSQAKNFYMSRNASSALKSYKNVSLEAVYDVVVSVITVSRNRIQQKPPYKPMYLYQNVWKLLSLLEQYEKQTPNSLNFGLFVCNVDSNPDYYEEAKSLEKFVTVVKQFTNHHFSMVHILEKEKEDYTFCLRQSFKRYNSKYYLLLEDDALPKDNMLKVVENIIKYINQQILMLHFSYIKFYHPERLLSYFSPIRLLELIATSLFLSPIVVYCIIAKYPHLNKGLIWILATIYIICILLSIGRVNVIQLKQLFSPYLYSLSPAPSCCTPALMFNNRSIERIINYMNNKHCHNGYAKDSILDEFVINEKVPAYIVEPNVVSHIGVFSALRSTRIDPNFI